jgi:hypothetical protein
LSDLIMQKLWWALATQITIQFRPLGAPLTFIPNSLDLEIVNEWLKTKIENCQMPPTKTKKMDVCQVEPENFDAH